MDYRKPSECPYYLITRTSLSLTATLKNEFATITKASIKIAYLGVLICLWDRGGAVVADGEETTKGMKIKDLCRCAGIEPSTMTGLIDRMESDGLVVRVSAPTDRRALNVELTPLGEALREETMLIVNRVLERAFAGIEEKSLEDVKRILRMVLVNIGANDEEG